MNVKIGVQGAGCRVQGAGRRGAVMLGAIICVVMAAGFSTNAYAICTRPKVASGLSPDLVCQRRPIPYIRSYSWGTLHGTKLPSQSTVDANSQPTGYADVHGTIKASQGVAITELSHSVLETSAITLVNGTKAYKLYVSTKSAYAPNGDSATFVFSTSGKLISGTQSTLQRLRSEVEDADPDAFISIGAIPNSFWSSFEHDIGCAGAAAMDLGAGMALLDPASAPQAAGVIFGMGGWSVLARTTETMCF